MGRKGLIGYTGFIGGILHRSTDFDAVYNSSTIADIRGQSFEVLICAAPQAKKWWANQNPQLDRAMIEKLQADLELAKAERFVLISSVDVFPRPQDVDETFDCASIENHPYGRHRLQLEQFVTSRFPSSTIIRLPGLFGPDLKKNVIFDMLNQNRLEQINPHSEFQWYDLTRLWSDIQTINSQAIPLMVMATEPIATQEIQSYFFADLSIGSDPSPAVHYNVRTRYGETLGGTHGYVMDRQQILSRMERFIQIYREQQ